jgi:hypothetical protein
MRAPGAFPKEKVVMGMNSVVRRNAKKTKMT